MMIELFILLACMGFSFCVGYGLGRNVPKTYCIKPDKL